MFKLINYIPFGILLLFAECKSAKIPDQKYEKQKVENCRNLWHVETFEKSISIKLLRLEPKGHYDLQGWPNFFIGISKENDTIGIIDYDSDAKFKKGAILFFKPARSKYVKGILTSLSDYPVFTVYPKSIENDLYCSVKKIYYGELIQ